MTTLPSFFSLLIIIILSAASHTRASTELFCESVGLPIQFPFSVRNSNQTRGYPGFEISCSNNTIPSQPLITLPESGHFAVKLISTEQQRIWINDPDECLPQRIMRDRRLNLNGSPFRLSDFYTLVDFSFFSCPSNLTDTSLVDHINCVNLSSVSSNYSRDVKHSVVAMVSNPPFPTAWAASCQLITTASIPVKNMPWLFWNDYNADIPLQWDNPDCRSCEARGGQCGFRDDHDLRVACYGLPSQSQGISRKAKVGMGLGIPGLLGFIGLAWIFCCKKTSGPQQRQTGTELSTLIIPNPLVVTTMGLDVATIERYPKTQLGESGRLPRPNDNVCSICLCEYQPMEMLRTIPECNHYFHANCIDGWLKMNATCPLCRKLPERSPSLPSSLPLSQTSQQLSL